MEGLKPINQDTKSHASSDVEHNSGDSVQSGRTSSPSLINFTRRA